MQFLSYPVICTLLTIGVFLAEVSGQTREIIFDEIHKDDGVLYKVSSLIQDHKGFIWFRTSGNPGIQRFDGYRFETFLDSAGFFNSIMEDRSGLIWLGSNNGITIFNPENEKSLQDYISVTSRNNSNHITEIVQDSKGDYWCASGNGILKFKAVKTTDTGVKDAIFENGVSSAFEVSDFKLNDNDSITGINAITKLYEDSRKRIWIGGNGGLFIFDPISGSLTRIDDIEGRSRLNYPYISSIAEENPDVFWVGTGNGAYRVSNVVQSFKMGEIDKSRLVFEQFLGMKLITGMINGENNTLWIGTYLNGLIQMKYNTKGKPEFREIYTDLQDPEGEGARTIITLLKDRTGLIWTGHQYGGIRKFDPEGNNFISYKELVRSHFSNYDLNPIYKDRHGNLWIGTMGGGLYKIDRNGNVFNFYIIDGDIPGKAGNGILSLLEIADGEFWIGAANGIWQFNAATGKSKKLFMHTDFGELNNYVYDIRRFNGFILFTLWGEGLFLYDLQTKNMKRYRYDRRTGNGIPSDILYTICNTGDSVVYAGGINGLTRFKIDRTTGELIFQNLQFAGLTTIKTTINKIYSDQDGDIWCGTNSGLLKIDHANGIREFWNQQDGSTTYAINAIEEDDQGRLWLGTSKGLSVVNPVTGKIRSFRSNQGLPMEIHGHHSSFKDREGRIFFGGIGGFYSFRPDSMKINKMAPPVVITDFRIFNKSVKPFSGKSAPSTHISYTNKIELRYNQNDIAFEFAALDYRNSSLNKYAYRLKGYRDDWIETDAESRVAHFTNLNPDEYIFQVKGSNDDGIWDDPGTSIQILIRPSFWKTTLAYFAYAVLLLFVIRGYIFWRTWKLRKEKALLENQVKERTHVIEIQKQEILHQKEELQTTLENLRKTQGQLIESEKMAALGGLVAGVAHEINTPVGIGITAITTLMDDIQKTAERFKKNEISRQDFKEFMQSTYDTGELIHKNLERTASLVQSFKQVSVDQVTEQQRVFNIKAYLEDIIFSLRPRLRKKDIRLVIDCDDKLELNSFPGVFAQIFTNMLLNSLQHAFSDKDTGNIIITVNMSKEFLYIQYSDDGHGISRKDLPHVFEPFYTTDQQKGLGLGLNITYNLIRQKLNGFITCVSEPGMGAAFKIEIPVVS